MGVAIPHRTNSQKGMGFATSNNWKIRKWHGSRFRTKNAKKGIGVVIPINLKYWKRQGGHYSEKRRIQKKEWGSRFRTTKNSEKMRHDSNRLNQCLPGSGAGPVVAPANPGSALAEPWPRQGRGQKKFLGQWARRDRGQNIEPVQWPRRAPRPGLKFHPGRKCQPGHGSGGPGNPGSCFDEFSKCGVPPTNRILGLW